MTDLATIPAKKRIGNGTGDARAVRRTGDIPGVIYGAGIEPRAITITVRDITKHYESGRFTSTLFELNLEGEKMRVIPREVQVDPVSERPIHASAAATVSAPRRSGTRNAAFASPFGKRSS